jgi:hypothetical protein
MAIATFSGNSAARNPLCPKTKAPAANDAVPTYPGLIGHALVSPSVQVQILSVIDATGAASIGDIIAELPGHADPVGAIFAMIAADVLTVVTTGIIDAHSIVARTNNNGPKGRPHADNAEPTAPETIQPTSAEDNIEASNGIQPIDFASIVPEALPNGLRWVSTSELRPRVIIASGSRRAAFRRAELLRQTGVYLLLRGHEVYVGYGTDIALRATSGRQTPGGAPDAIIGIVEAQNRLRPRLVANADQGEIR